MGLSDFERELATDQASRSQRKRRRSRSCSPRREHRRHHKGHRRSSPNDNSEDYERRSRHHRKRSRRHEDIDGRDGLRSRRERNSSESPQMQDAEDEEDEWVEKGSGAAPSTEEGLNKRFSQASEPAFKRDSWMESPLALELDFVQRKAPPKLKPQLPQEEPPMKLYDNELNYQLKEIRDKTDTGTYENTDEDMSAPHEVKYTFGDAGSSWRMMKLRAVHRQAMESGKPVEDIAVERYGDLRSFDDAREEETEIERRKLYGKDYIGKEKPSGELFQERKLNMDNKRNMEEEGSEDEFEAAQGMVMRDAPRATTTVTLDQTALNKLKAQMMRAKLKGDPTATKLEAEYNAALSGAANSKKSDVVVLDKMENRMLVGGRTGEVKHLENKRGRERGLVEENEDMSIEDMVRHERRTRGQAGGEGRAFAERIAKDGKFDNDLDYMDENAYKLAKHVQKSDVNLRNTAIEDYQKMQRILDTCPLCQHEDTNTPPQAPVVSLATRTYLTLPTAPEISPIGLGATVVPIQHRLNLLECDEDEWEELRNFMKSLTRLYDVQSPPLTPIFYENATHEGRKRHASLEVVPLPKHLAATAPAFFKESILAADEEWTQHRKLIDTLAKATTGGLGKLAFRRSMVTQLPYFHVWFTLDGGLGHVVEDVRRWPKGDLFAREILGGMLDIGPEVVTRQGRWRRGDGEMEKRVKRFRTKWDKWDWTSVLTQ